MGDVDLSEAGKIVHRIVKRAMKDDSLEQFTPRLIRQMVEEEMGLEAGALDVKEYKNALRIKISEATQAPDEEKVEEVEEKAEEAEEKDTPSKEVASANKPAKASKRKSHAATADDSESPPVKKPKAAPKRDSKKAASKPISAKGKNAKVVRSASIIPSSDDEQSAEKKPTKKSPPKSKRPSLPKNKSENDADISSNDVTSSPDKKDKKRAATGGDVEDETAAKSTKPKSKLSQFVTADDLAMEDQQEGPSTNGGEAKSDSELSVLIDEPPKRGRKRKEKSDAPPTKRTRKTKEAIEESPDDQEIKRLKSFVVACGVRKVWSKEFKDIPEDKKAQIRRLKDVLSGLGMTGRLSMEKAKSIKEKRELAQELEDVQSFEKAVIKGPTPSRRSKVAQESSGGNDSDIEDLPPRKRVTNARANIDAFLGDQSDDD